MPFIIRHCVVSLFAVNYLPKCSYHKCKSYRRSASDCKSIQELRKANSRLSLKPKSCDSEEWVSLQGNRRSACRMRWSKSRRDETQLHCWISSECTVINRRSSDGFNLPNQHHRISFNCAELSHLKRQTTKSSRLKQKPHTECTEFTFKCLFSTCMYGASYLLKCSFLFSASSHARMPFSFSITKSMMMMHDPMTNFSFQWFCDTFSSARL